MAKDIGKRVSSLNGHKGRWEKAGQPEVVVGGVAAAQPPPDGELSRANKPLIFWVKLMPSDSRNPTHVP
jgi:hypothetical protein